MSSLETRIKYIPIAIALLAIASMIFATPSMLQAYASTSNEKNDLDVAEQGDDDNEAKALKMAVKEGGKTNKVDGFKLGPDNVLVIEPNKKVEVTEDLNNGDTFDRALITDNKDKEKKVSITKDGVVDFKGFKEGSYTLDVVIKSGDKKIAYECIVVVGEKNEQNRNKGNDEANRVSETTTINKKITIIKETDCGPGTKFDEKTDQCEIIKKKPPTPPPVCKQGQTSTKEKPCTPPKPPTDTPTPPPDTKTPPQGPAGGGKTPPPVCKAGQQSTSQNPCTPQKTKTPTPPLTPTKPLTPPTTTGGPMPDCETGDISKAIQCVTKGGNVVNLFPPGSQKVACPQFSSGECVKPPNGPLVPIAGGLIDLPNGQLGTAGPPSLTGPLGPLNPNNPVGKVFPECPPGGPITSDCIPGPNTFATPQTGPIAPLTPTPTEIPQTGPETPPTLDECLATQNQIPGCEQVNPDPGHVIPFTPTGPEDCPSGKILESFPPKCAPEESTGPPLTVDPPAAPIGPEDCPSGRILESFPPKCAPVEPEPTPIPDPPTETPTPPIDPGHIACNPGQVSTPENPCNDTGQLPTEPTNVTPIPDPTTETEPIPEPNICDDPANAGEPECQEPVTDETLPPTDTPTPEPTDDQLLFGDDAATLEEGTDSYDDGDTGAARTLEGQEQDKEDNGSGNLVPPTPDVTTEGSTNEDEDSGGGTSTGTGTGTGTGDGGTEPTTQPPEEEEEELTATPPPDTTTQGTMDETNPQDRTAPPVLTPPVTPPTDGELECEDDEVWNGVECEAELECEDDESLVNGVCVADATTESDETEAGTTDETFTEPGFVEPEYEEPEVPEPEDEVEEEYSDDEEYSESE